MLTDPTVQHCHTQVKKSVQTRHTGSEVVHPCNCSSDQLVVFLRARFVAGNPASNRVTTVSMVCIVNENEALLVAEARRAAEDGSARLIRLAAGLSQAEVGLVCHVTGQAVARWENTDPDRRRSPKGEPAVRYARLLQRLRQSPAVASQLAKVA